MLSRLVLPAPVRVKKVVPPRKPSDEDVAYIKKRDGGCVLAQLPGITQHVCRDEWGTPHPWDAVDMCTVEHVKESPRLGKRATSDRWHMVMACGYSNIRNGETSKYRQKIREYLAEKEPKPLDIGDE
jgi:hypothetical protein